MRRHATRSDRTLRPLLGRHRRRLRRPRQVGQLAGPRCAPGRASPAGVPHQPQRQAGARARSLQVDSRRSRRARPGRRVGSGGRFRAGGRRRAEPSAPTRSWASRPVWESRAASAQRARAQAGRARAGGRRDPARPQLPGGVRRLRRAGDLLQRVPRRADRADLPERQPGPRAGHHGSRVRPRVLALRLARKSVRRRPGRAGDVAGPARRRPIWSPSTSRISATAAPSSRPRPAAASRWSC